MLEGVIDRVEADEPAVNVLLWTTRDGRVRPVQC